MFGASNNAFAGFANNNQQQQPQQPASLFGAAQPSTPFNAFGQQNNPAPFSQPQSTGFGTNAFGTSAPATGFGSTPAPANVFGQPQAQPNTSLFGASAQPQAAPATGFGGFGAAAAPANNAFGAFSGGATNNSTGTGLFGQKPATPATTFGAGNTAFTPNVFGQNTAAPFGAAANPTMPSGTANPPYAPVTLAENESTPSQKSTFNSIVAMDAYKNMSFEELRFQDYSQGRKTAAPANAMAAGFGGGQQQGQQISFSPFNNNNSNPPQVGGFGQQPAQGGLFGSTPGTSAFGAQAPSTNNMFGQAATNNPSPFGQAQNTTNPSPFGAPGAQPTNTFGSNNLFNNSSNTTPFGAQQAKPNIFGSGTTNNAFGQPPTSAAPTNSLFGSTPAQPQNNPFGVNSSQNAPTGGGLFGNNNNNTNNQASGGLFGLNNNQNNTQKPGGLFGSNTNTTGTSLFGQSTQQPTNNNNAFGFSQNNQQQQPSGGLFGGNNQQQSNTGGLFGMNNNQQNQSGTGGGLFGNNNANNNTQNNGLGNAPGGGLFGNNNNQTGGGLFGQKPLSSTGSLFGNKDNPVQNNTNNFGNSIGGGLFGGSQNSNQGFGGANNNNNANVGNNSLFGSMNNSQPFQNQTNNQNGLFQSQQNQQPSLQARIDQDAYGNNPLFANHGISSGGSRPAIPIRKQLPTIDFKPMSRPNTKITKLRGFARSASPTKTTGGGSSMGASTASNNASVVSRSSAYARASEEPLLSPKAFIVKPSPKKLTIDPATLSNLFRNRSTTLNGSPGPADGTPPPSGTQNMNRLSTRSMFDPDAEASAQDLFSRPPQQRSLRATAGQRPESGASARGTNAPSLNNDVRSSTSPTRRTTQSEQEPVKDHAIMEDEVVVSTKGKAQEGEYWTVPSIDELCLMSRNDLKAVPNLTAGRVGYGQIEFQREVDLRGIKNLREGLCGSVIVFNQSLCSVYPKDPVDKPPIGEGLNVPAVITLENCWAVDKATRAPLKEPNHPRVKLFVKRLMKSQDTEFIDYDALNGRWTFSVEHFTTYGIDESDEEGDEEDEDGLTPSDEGTDATDSETSVTFIHQARRAGQASRPTKPLRLDEDEEDDGPPRAMLFDEEEEDEELYERPVRRGEIHDEETTASVTGSDDVDGPAKQQLVTKKRSRQGTEGEEEEENEIGGTDEPDRTWRAQVGVESRKVAVMQASLFARPDQVRRSVKTLEIGLPKSGTRADFDLAKLLKPLREEPPKKQEQPFRQQTPLAQTAYQQPKGKKASAVAVKLRLPKHIPLAESLVNRKGASVIDMPMSMCRSIRVSWVGQSDRVVHLGRGSIGNMVDCQEEYSSFGDLAIRTVPTHAFELEREIQAAKRLLEVQLEHTVIRVKDGVPLAETRSTLRFRDFQARYEKTDRSSDANIWSLCEALFDELELAIPAGASGEVAERIRAIRREDAFSSWLERVVGPSVEQDARGAGRQGGAGAIFRLLTGNQIERACEAAMETGHYRLATLIAQCGRSDGMFKEDMRQQMATWRELRVDGHMDRELRKSYELLAGNATVARGFGKKGLHADWSEEIMLAEQLDWKRALGLHIWFPAAQNNFWYGVQTFEEAFKKEGSAPAPVPWYIEQAPEGCKRQWKAVEPVYDGLYQIVKMFVDPTYALETVLEPRGFGPSPFDYRMPWHLYRMIGRVLKMREFEDRELIMGDMEGMEQDEVEESGSLRADLVTSRYAEQLVRMGEWKWAVFVYLHLEQAGCREQAVQKLIERNIGKIDSETEDFIVEKLKVPPTWIYGARAERAYYEGRYYEQVGWLKKAGRFADAHRMVVWELAPEGVIKGDLKLVGKLFEGLSSENVADWATGGKVFMEYVAVMEQGTRLVRALARPDEQSESESEDEQHAAGAVEGAMASLLKEIPGMYVEGMSREMPRMKHRVCVSEMMAGLASLVSAGIGSRVESDGLGGGVGVGPGGGRGAAGTGEKVVWVQRWARSGLERAVQRACGAVNGGAVVGSHHSKSNGKSSLANSKGSTKVGSSKSSGGIVISV